MVLEIIRADKNEIEFLNQSNKRSGAFAPPAVALVWSRQLHGY